MYMRGVLLLIVALMLAGCAAEKPETVKLEKTMKVSSVFDEGATIPKKYTCDGEDVSPPLYISDFPPNAKSLVIICEDPDAPAGTFTHWLAWNVEVRSEIPEGIPKVKIVGEPVKMVQGKNDFNQVGYNGPCPPPGKPHRYFFRIYALDTTLDGYFTKDELLKAMEGHIVGYGETYGTYQR